MTFSVATELLTYENARKRCQQHGSDLASVGDEEEQEFIAANVIQEPDDYWIGLDDEKVEGQFEWVDGYTFTLTL